MHIKIVFISSGKKSLSQVSIVSSGQLAPNSYTLT